MSLFSLSLGNPGPPELPGPPPPWVCRSRQARLTLIPLPPGHTDTDSAERAERVRKLRQLLVVRTHRGPGKSEAKALLLRVQSASPQEAADLLESEVHYRKGDTTWTPSRGWQTKSVTQAPFRRLTVCKVVATSSKVAQRMLSISAHLRETGVEEIAPVARLLWTERDTDGYTRFYCEFIGPDVRHSCPVPKKEWKPLRSESCKTLMSLGFAPRITACPHNWALAPGPGGGPLRAVLLDIGECSIKLDSSRACSDSGYI